MKKIIFIGLIFSALSSQATSIDAWRGILQTPELVEYFDNVFQRLGIEVEETGERFTIEHTGSELILSDGIDESNVDFIVPIKLQNIQNMINHSKDGKIDSSESWRILDVLFTVSPSLISVENPSITIPTLSSSKFNTIPCVPLENSTSSPYCALNNP